MWGHSQESSCWRLSNDVFKENSLSSSSCQLPIVPQLGSEFCVLLYPLWWDFVELELEQVLGMLSQLLWIHTYVQPPCCIQKIVSPWCHALTLFPSSLFYFHNDILKFWGRGCDIHIPLMTEKLTVFYS